ncbi:hypothetical protein FOMG_10736 [Fusarium oxysporum f. sp. melonis 26406]|uniref:Uncharacterized protein n=1 Tax=Fusarium oxysporum f. sp. melonis 26406 TaxID=1089452 RepID=X0AK09_FUSOX|nr:hypothetical protein FOMG_10736 [Fusarium oxysporum f. sp. melonis 26406]
MGLLKYLEPVIQTRRFLTDFFWITYANDDEYSWDEAELNFPVGPEFGLSVKVDNYISTIQLHFNSQDKKHFLGYDDNLHWQPYKLRWSELEAICQAVPITDRKYSHPGLPLLILARFTPICIGDDVDHIVEILVQAWKTLGEDILTDDQIRQVIERIDNRDMQLCWHYDESRSYWWVGKGLDESTATKAYTYRRSRELDCEEPFPNEQWNAFISAVQNIVDEFISTGKRYDLTMTLDLTMGDFPVDKAAVNCLLKTLGAVLQSLCLGKAGSLYQEDTTVMGKHIETKRKIWIRIMDELSLGRGIIKQMLWWLRVSPSVMYSNELKPNDSPLQIVDRNADALEGAFRGICQLSTSGPDTQITYILPTAIQSVLESTELLGTEITITGPTALGWSTMDTADNGRIEFNFTKFPQGIDAGDENPGVITIRQLTLQVSAVLHRFMSAASLVLLPMLLTAKPLSEEISCHWKGHCVVTSEELYDLLSAGAYEWWVRGTAGAA